MRNSWEPSWWRRITWGEFKAVVQVSNEAWEDERRRDREHADEDDPAAAGLRDERLGKPPSAEELRTLPALP